MDLYPIQQKHRELFNKMESMVELGEIDRETAIAIIKTHIEEDSDLIIEAAKEVANLRALSEAIKHRMTDMASRRIATDNRIDGLVSIIKSVMEMAGENNISTPDVSLKIKKKAPTIRIDDEGMIPERYFEERIDKRLDKRELLKEAKQCDGGIPGCTLIKDQTRLEIK